MRPRAVSVTGAAFAVSAPDAAFALSTFGAGFGGGAEVATADAFGAGYNVSIGASGFNTKCRGDIAGGGRVCERGFNTTLLPFPPPGGWEAALPDAFGAEVSVSDSEGSLIGTLDSIAVKWPSVWVMTIRSPQSNLSLTRSSVSHVARTNCSDSLTGKRCPLSFGLICDVLKRYLMMY